METATFRDNSAEIENRVLAVLASDIDQEWKDDGMRSDSTHPMPLHGWI